MSDDPQDPRKLKMAGDPADVPTFACVVYVSSMESGVKARVANLPGLECDGASERDALGKIVPEFKKRIAELVAAGKEIPWIDPPLPIEPDEQKRFVPVHL